MKTLKRIAGVLLSISILFSTNSMVATAATQQLFKDVKNTDWYYSDVTKLIELNITSGAGNGMYKPNNSVTRAEFVTFICRALGAQPAQNNPFIDTKKHWADGYITIALANNMISLPANKKFRPNDAITRAEAVEVMCRALNVQPDNAMKTPYADVKANTGYINAAYSNYLMQGSLVKGQRYFYPSNKLSRGEVSKIIVNAYDYSKDKMAFLNKAMAEEQKRIDAEKEKAEKYQAWVDSIDKNINPDLLKNTTGLYKNMTPFESHQYLETTEKDCLKNGGAKYYMTPEQFEKEMVRVGTEFMDLWGNVNYKKIDVFENGLKTLWETPKVNYIDENVDYIKNHTVVSEGKFYTGSGMLVYVDWGNPVLRGTLRYKYSTPTSKEGLNNEIVGSTKKPSQLNTWYEQDFEITFYAEYDHLSVARWSAISDIRIAKKGI